MARSIFGSLAILCFCVAVPLQAKERFAPITAAQRSLTAVAWEPDARAVVLEKSGEFWMLDESRNRFSSRLVVSTRIKVLGAGSEEDLGEVEVIHSADHRLYDLEGRTVRPDGTAVPLGEDSIFERTVSESDAVKITTLVFPAVEPGAILDYSYEIRFDSIWFLEPWYFQDRYPVALSKIVYHLPGNIATVTWGQNILENEMESETTKEPGGNVVAVWMRQLPAVPRENFAIPFADMSSRFMVLPAYIVERGQKVMLLEDWTTTCSIVDDYIYSPYWARARKTKARVKALTAAARGVEDRVGALFTFVRDEIDSIGWSGISPYRSSVDQALEEGSGTSADKTLLLYKMLDLAGIESEIVWIADRAEGHIDPQVANPGWFDRPILRVSIGGAQLFLDPASGMGPGYLPAGAEGMPALVFHQRKPSIIMMPAGAAEDNRRRIAFELAATDEGGLVGSANLEFTGHHAAAMIDFGDTAEDTREQWAEWLEENLATFDATGVDVSEEAHGPRVTVRFNLALASSEILGDEIALKPSRPLGPVRQIFEAEDSRRSPVLFDFADLDEVTVRLAVPAPWRVEARPAPMHFQNAAGSLVATLAEGEGGTLTYERRLRISEREFSGRNPYKAIRSLFAQAAKHDAQELVLVRP